MSNSKEGWLKIKLHSESKWHRRYCIIDWDKNILFMATKTNTRYRNWIKLLSNIIINDYDYLFNNETNINNNLLINTIEIKTDDGTVTHFLQAETKKEYDSWLLALKQTAYSRISGAIFGQSLDDTYKYSRDKTSLVPLIVRQCCEYLLEYGSTFVGLFRVPGKQSTIKELRDMYDRGLSIELNSSYSPATISSLLKIYLQSLPEPIIPTKNFDDFLEIGSRLKYNQTNDLDRLKQLIETTLIKINYTVLEYLCLFLKKLTNYAQTTKMDTDNLAVVFGNNLIRPAGELDLSMIKGHNYNLIPLIKVLIDHSEYLFSNNSINQLHDSYEQTNESITKSSGFSSFSSLLSSNEHSLTKTFRSSSMPSISIPTSLSFDSANLSIQKQLEINDRKSRPKSFIEKQNSFTSDHSNDDQLFTISLETNQNNTYRNKQLKTKQTKRSSSTDLLDNNQIKERIKHNTGSMDDILLEQKQTTDISSRPISTINVPITKRKMEKYPPKKGFVNRFGKSFSTLKSNMSKALQSHISSNENNETINTIDSLSSNQQFETKSLDFNLSNNSLKILQNDINILKELLNKKDLLINDLTKNIREEHLKYEKEIFQLNQQIEQLQNENIKLKKSKS